MTVLNLESRLLVSGLNIEGNMINKENRLITSALPYINNVPHLGHIVGSHLPADIFARYCRAKGYSTLFVGGTDEHGSTTEIIAEEIGVDVKRFGDVLFEEHKKVYNWFNISYDHFSRTVRPIHHETTKEFFKVIYDKGFVTKGTMKVFYSKDEKRFLPDRYIVGTCPKCQYKNANGDQCEKCTSVLDPMQLVNPRSSISGSPLEIREANHLFLRLDKLSPQIEEWIKKQKNWRPQVKSIALGWIKEGLRERCITRDLKHGIPVPLTGFEDKVFYVWFDAPIGYLSASKEARPHDWQSFWQEKEGRIYHFLGKDNIPFHTIFWPGMLLAHGNFNLPHNVVGLQYLNYEGGKFSKSQKRGVFCEKLPETNINPDLLRGYLAFIMPERSDSEFKWDDFQKRINGDIIGNYGNFINRTASFVCTRLNGIVSKPSESRYIDDDQKLAKTVNKKVLSIGKLLEEAEFKEAFNEILSLSTVGNKYFESNKPWELIKNNLQRANEVLYHCAGLCRTLSVLAAPFLPCSSQKIWKHFKLKGVVDSPNIWDSAGDIYSEAEYNISAPLIIFNKITESSLIEFKKTVSDTKDIKEFFN